MRSFRMLMHGISLLSCNPSRRFLAECPQNGRIYIYRICVHSHYEVTPVDKVKNFGKKNISLFHAETIRLEPGLSSIEWRADGRTDGVQVRTFSRWRPVDSALETLNGTAEGMTDGCYVYRSIRFSLCSLRILNGKQRSLQGRK